MTNPARPQLECCVPHMAPYPSGWAWTHDPKCEEDPNQKVDRVNRPYVATAFDTWMLHGSDGCKDCEYIEHWLDRDDDLGAEARPGCIDEDAGFARESS